MLSSMKTWYRASTNWAFCMCVLATAFAIVLMAGPAYALDDAQITEHDQIDTPIVQELQGRDGRLSSGATEGQTEDMAGELVQIQAADAPSMRDRRQILDDSPKRLETSAALVSQDDANSMAVVDDAAAAEEEEPSYEETHVNMYRLYNPNSGEHFYTSDFDEAIYVAGVGWRWEDVGWVAPIKNDRPVFRLYNSNAGDHHYTLNIEERDWLIGLGWIDEGIGWYSDSDDQLAVWRQYNPNAVSGAHNFTTSASEDEFLGSVGWMREGMAWRATDGPCVQIEGRWLVTAAWGSLERYWIDSFGAIARDRIVESSEGAGYDAFATASGAVVRGKHDSGNGYVYIADNDGRLASTSNGEDGWIVTDAYDGGLQRYYYVASMRAMRSGFFDTGDAKYFGVGGQGYVLRGKMSWGDYVLLADNDGLLAAGVSWLVTDRYDGGLQRYWLEYVWLDFSGARVGLFDVDGTRYYGTPKKGYVARNRYFFGGDQWYHADNDGVLNAISSLEMKDALLAILDTASPSSHLTVFGDSDYDLNSAAGARLANAVNALRGSGYGVGFAMIDLTTGYGVASAPHDVRYSASTIKGPYVAAINHFAPGSMDGGDLGLMSNTILYSSNEDYAALRYGFGAGVMQDQLNYCNVHSIDPGSWYVYYSATDLAKLWVGNYWYFYQDTNGNSEWCRNLYTEGLTEGNSVIHDALSGWYTVHTKPGWFPGGGYDVQNDAGIVIAGDHPYVVSIMSSACGMFGELRELVCAIDVVHADMVR